MKKRFRQIIVDGQTYLWRFQTGYLRPLEENGPWQCHDQFFAYLAAEKAGPLQIHFRTWADPVIGGPLRTGVPVDLAAPDAGAEGANLHTPGAAARLIRLALQAGWAPAQNRVPFVVADGLPWLAAM